MVIIISTAIGLIDKPILAISRNTVVVVYRSECSLRCLCHICCNSTHIEIADGSIPILSSGLLRHSALHTVTEQSGSSCCLQGVRKLGMESDHIGRQNNWRGKRVIELNEHLACVLIDERFIENCPSELFRCDWSDLSYSSIIQCSRLGKKKPIRSVCCVIDVCANCRNTHSNFMVYIAHDCSWNSPESWDNLSLCNGYKGAAEGESFHHLCYYYLIN